MEARGNAWEYDKKKRFLNSGRKRGKRLSNDASIINTQVDNAKYICALSIINNQYSQVLYKKIKMD